MQAYVLTFSPTGGTERVALSLTCALEETRKHIDLCDRAEGTKPRTFTKDSLCFVAVPVFSGRIPPTAAERLRSCTGGGAWAVPVVVYGDRAYEDALLELSDLLKTQGFRILAGVSAIAEHSIVPCYATNRPNMKDREKLIVFGLQILEKLKTPDAQPPDFPGNRPYRAVHGGLKPQVTPELCVHCGWCAEACPVGAIAKDDPTVTDLDRCISCMRCIKICASQKEARHLDKDALSALTERLKEPCAVPKEPELFL